jgi:DNA processing protein
MLALDDTRLIDAVAASDDRLVREYERFDPTGLRETCRGGGLTPLCRHDRRYPAALVTGSDAPAVIYVAGDPLAFCALLAEPGIAIVGARHASPYGVEVARSLGRDLAAAKATVISGMALGVDSAAHADALDAPRDPGGSGSTQARPAATIAVLGSGADIVYPATKRALYRALVAEAAVISELPPGYGPRRWSFPARNRIIAGLAGLTVVVEAAERSGALITAEFACELGREVGAVPGHVSSPLAAGTNGLLRDGAHLIRGAQDALDVVFGVGVRVAERTERLHVDTGLQPLLDDVGAGRDTLAVLAARHGTDAAMTGLAALELKGLIRRHADGRYVCTR